MLSKIQAQPELLLRQLPRPRRLLRLELETQETQVERVELKLLVVQEQLVVQAQPRVERDGSKDAAVSSHERIEV